MATSDSVDVLNRSAAPELETIETEATDYVVSSPRWHRRFQQAAVAATFASVLVAGTVLLGWLVDVPMLRSWMLGQAAMRMNTSLSGLACALAVLALALRQPFRRAAVVALAIVPAVFGCGTLVEQVTGHALGIDLLPRRLAAPVASDLSGRMATNTALAFVLLAVALVLLTWESRRARVAAQSLAVVCGVIGLVALLGYTYDVRAFYVLGHDAAMAFPTAVLLSVLALAVAFKTPDCGFVAALAGKGVGSIMLRRILPLAIVVPWVVGWFAAKGNQIGLYGTNVDDVLFAAVLMAVLTAVLYANSAALNRIDAKREHTQDVLRRNTEQWQLTFDCMSEGLSYHNVDYTVVGSNSAFRNLICGSGDNLCQSAIHGEKCYKSVHGTEAPPANCPMRKTLATGKTWEEEIFEPRLGKHLLVRTDPVRDSNGEIFRIVHVVEDITERKRAEEKIKRLASIVEQSDDAIFSNDLDGRILTWNKGAERVYGYTSEESLGRTLHVLCPPESPDDFIPVLQRVRCGEIVENVEKVRVRKDGTRFWVSLTVSPLRNAAGTVVEFSAIARDITAQKLAAEEIDRRGAEANRARAELNAVVDSMGEGLYQLDAEARLVFMNTACERMLGYSIDEIRGRLMHDVIHSRLPDGTVRPADECPLLKVIKLGDTYHEAEDVFQRKDGSFFTVEYTSSPLVVDGKSIGAVLSFRDITERKRAEAERSRLLDLERCARREVEAKNAEIEKLNAELEVRVRQRTLELEVANKELEAFSYSVSHDLRAPLRSLDGFSHILLDEYKDKLDDEGRDFLNRLRAASQTMGQLIDALLQLSRVTRSEMSREPVDLSAIARQITDDLKRGAPERKVELLISESLKANGDPRLIHVLLLNLLGNAWKFTAKRELAHIEFGTTACDGVPAFFIRDNGAGFDMKYGSKLFAAFQRLHSGSEFEGSGIGLATVQRIVRRHGGKVWADGVPGMGATFYFTLN